VRSLGKGRPCVRLHTGLAAQEGEGIVIGTGESGGNAATRSRRGRSAVKDVIYFNGQRYRPAFLRTSEPYARRASVPAAHLQEIGAGTRPQCRSGSRADLDHYRSVPVASIDGVSPEIAIAALPRGNIYVRQGAVVPPALAAAPWMQWTIVT
jgi:hypothetical protein